MRKSSLSENWAIIYVVQFFHKLNPENNLGVRAILYLIGVGGAIHFVTLFIIAIKLHNWVWFNPLFAIDVDRIYPRLQNTYLTFFGGWLAMTLGAWSIYKLLKRAGS